MVDLGETLLYLGCRKEAQKLLRECFEICSTSGFGSAVLSMDSTTNTKDAGSPQSGGEESNLGPGSKLTLRTVHLFARALELQSLYQEALEMFEICVDAKRHVYGEDSCGTEVSFFWHAIDSGVMT